MSHEEDERFPCHEIDGTFLENNGQVPLWEMEDRVVDNKKSEKQEVLVFESIFLIGRKVQILSLLILVQLLHGYEINNMFSKQSPIFISSQRKRKTCQKK